MCDTLVALPGATADGSTILAKNSDREPNEAQAISYYPRRTYAAGETLRCTYIDIPQVRETHAVLLSRPFWMWGAEMGGNEHGVVIGNEAVYVRVKVPKTGLTGMDLVRLGLERASTADAALETITSLLEAHGQGGSGGYQHPFYYHNSYIIADRSSAWVLETVDRHWAARRVKDVASISNGLTIGSEFDACSKNLEGYAVRRGWCQPGNFHFARCYSDILYVHFTRCRVRQPHTHARLREAASGIDPLHMMAALRAHHPTYRPASGSNADVCMHHTDGLIRKYQSTASLVAHLRPDGGATYWLTGTAAPCLSTFKPFYCAELPAELGPEPGPRYDPTALWWHGERLHRAVLKDYAARAEVFRDERDRLEERFLAEETRGRADPLAYSAECLEVSRRATDAWIERVQSVAPQQPAPASYRRRWRGHAAAAGMPVG